MLPKPRRILVVEDHLAMGGVIQFALRKAGFEVMLARDGQVAWELLQRHEFDLVISDFQMPNINGGQLREMMCRDPRLASVPYVLVTAKGLELDDDYFRGELAICDILSKPFSPRALMRKAQEILAPEPEFALT